MRWVATWDYVPQVPSTYGKGFWSVPRDLELRTYPEGIRMVQVPVKNLETLRYVEVAYTHTLPVGVKRLPRFVPKKNVYELDVKH